MGTHAKLAPSAAHRWMRCPGSIQICEANKCEDSESEHARLGSFAHEYAAHCLKYGHEAIDGLGWTTPEFPEYEVDLDVVGAVQVYLEAVREVFSAVQSQHLHVEQPVFLKGLIDDIFGTVDCFFVSKFREVLHVFDYKHGAGVYVEILDNPQLKIYGLGVLLSRPNLENVRKVVVHIVQPRHHRGGHIVASYDRAELEHWAHSRLVPTANETKSNGRLEDGKHCRFCPAKPVCPQLESASLDVAKLVFADGDPKTPAPVNPKMIQIDKLGELLDKFPAIEAWMKAVREHAFERAQAGEKVPGWKLVRKKANRKWSDEDAAAWSLENSLPEGVEAFSAPKLLSPAAAEKLLPKKHRDLVDKFTIKPPAGFSLVPASDKRAGVTPADVFQQELDSDARALLD